MCLMYLDVLNCSRTDTWLRHPWCQGIRPSPTAFVSQLNLRQTTLTTYIFSHSIAQPPSNVDMLWCSSMLVSQFSHQVTCAHLFVVLRCCILLVLALSSCVLVSLVLYLSHFNLLSFCMFAFIQRWPEGCILNLMKWPMALHVYCIYFTMHYKLI